MRTHAQTVCLQYQRVLPATPYSISSSANSPCFPTFITPPKMKKGLQPKGMRPGNKRRKQLAAARAATKVRRLNSSEEVPNADAAEISEDLASAQPQECSVDLRAGNNASAAETLSASAAKLYNFRQHVGNEGENEEQAQGDSMRGWVLVETAQLDFLLAGARCGRNCANSSLSMQMTDTKLGFCREMQLVCSECGVLNIENSSPRINDSENPQDPFEVNERAVLYTHELGASYAPLQKLCTVFGMQGLSEKTFYKKDKKVCEAILSTTQTVLDQTADIVKAAYKETFPEKQPGDAEREEEEEEEEMDAEQAEERRQDALWKDMPWADVTFDGTWHKRGFSSLYGVAAVIDVLTGYVLDFEVLSKFCHVCAANECRLRQMSEREREAWFDNHIASCSINYEGSSKAMEKEAALRLWNR